MDNLSDLFIKCFGVQPDSVTRLGGGGSDRQYYRLCHRQMSISVIGTIGYDIKENDTFIYIDGCLRKSGVHVPSIIAASDDGKAYLQEDLGDTSLADLIGKPDFYPMLEKSIAALPDIQLCKLIDFDKCYPETEMGERQIRWDLNYFKYCFLKPSGIPFNESKLENDFDLLTNTILNTPEELTGFMYRDCQSRNIMIHNNNPYWIDFQSGRRGPVIYDIASLLWQAKANIPDEERMRLADLYFQRYSHITGYSLEKMRSMLPVFVIFRTLQVLGAYGFRGLVEHKSHFVTSIPNALHNLSSMINRGWLKQYPALQECTSLLCQSPRFTATRDSDKLTITVFSFSYKKGYPEDMSGNGGGFMFDCRSLHNPGRYEEYKKLTGLDKEVRDFLEERGEVQPFLLHTKEILVPAVEKYISRGFTSLQIGFGCTGGQHRSVYCAEAIGQHLAGKFGNDAAVKIIHREQNITKSLS